MRLSKSFGNPEGLSYDLVCPVWLVAMGVFPLFKEKRCIMGQIAPWERAWQSLVGSLNLKLPGAGEGGHKPSRFLQWLCPTAYHRLQLCHPIS